mmetsp:Transcript_89363/g.251641  ORF Transcript_89363/g.251641 Transcript_89363/m.251641 type:complete len:255 (-) Transcript_89363:56-820(-)
MLRSRGAGAPRPHRREESAALQMARRPWSCAWRPWWYAKQTPRRPEDLRPADVSRGRATRQGVHMDLTAFRAKDLKLALCSGALIPAAADGAAGQAWNNCIIPRSAMQAVLGRQACSSRRSCRFHGCANVPMPIAPAAAIAECELRPRCRSNTPEPRRPENLGVACRWRQGGVCGVGRSVATNGGTSLPSTATQRTWRPCCSSAELASRRALSDICRQAAADRGFSCCRASSGQRPRGTENRAASCLLPVIAHH